jgi:ribosome biogenesis protein SSF1/2
MPKKGGKRKKTRTHVDPNETSNAQGALKSKEAEKVPKSLILRRGKTAQEVAELVDDLRHLMLPFTALHFQEDSNNRKMTLTQYATSLALPMGVSHILAFSQTNERLNLRLARTPEGPTLSFRVHRFSLNRHLKALQKRPISFSPALQANPPIVVTNNFGSTDAPPHVKLMRVTFQNMFPATNVATVKLADCRRVVLFNYMEPTDAQPATVQMRHYAIRATPVGANKRVRGLARKKKLPNLGRCNDVADYIQGNALVSDAPSDSEAEDTGPHVVQLPDTYCGNAKNSTSALKLVELGPRLTLELIKVEKGLGAGGDVLYHGLIHKSPEEAAAIKAKREQEARTKQERRNTQERNVERKRREAEEKRQAKRQRREDKTATHDSSEASDENSSASESASDDDEAST